MGELVQCHWSQRYEGRRRADRLSGHYEAFVPDPLCGWEFAIPARLAGNLADAEAAIRSLNGPRSRDLEGLGRFLVRAESVGSSWIEGLAVPAGRLAVAAEGIERDVDTGDRVAGEVAANVLAMLSARRGDRFTLGDLLRAHRTLMSHSPLAESGGQVRAARTGSAAASTRRLARSSCRPPTRPCRH